MGAFGKESVLKLVHPGGFAEIHRRPVKASEVMEKNPRHCVTRTDVFKNPWIVVHPESVLEPGNVFFIVPNHKIYRLMQQESEALGRKAPDMRLHNGQQESTRKGQVCTAQNPTRSQLPDIPAVSSESQKSQLPERSGRKKLGIDHSRPRQAHLHGSPSHCPESNRFPPRLRKSPIDWSKVNSARKDYGNDSDDNCRGRTRMLASGRSVYPNTYNEVRVAPIERVNLKPCLKKDGQKRTKPDGLRVRFLLPGMGYRERWRVVA